jgi:large subunit ribosomal protein L4
MAQVTLFKQDASEAGKLELKDAVFAREVKPALLHQSVTAFLANQRQGTRGTRTRGLVSGGGKKPWKQKGTGRARQGSTRAPQWKGGGTVHGPQPQDFSIQLNKKVRQAALAQALSAKQKEGSLVVIDSFEIAKPRTKDVAAFLKGFKAESSKVTLVTDKFSQAALLSTRNLPKLFTTGANAVHPYHLLWADKVFLTKGAVAKLEEALD